MAGIFRELGLVGTIVMVGLLVIGIGGLGAGWYAWHTRYIGPDEWSPYKSDVERFADNTGLTDSVGNATYIGPGNVPWAASKGYLIGKLLPLDRATRRIDQEVYAALPLDLRASRPDEVGTVLLLTCEKESPSCIVEVVDVKAHTIVGREEVRRERGGVAPARSGEQNHPVEEIIAFINHLPRSGADVR